MSDLVKNESGAIVMKSFGDHAGQGFENQRQGDVQTPLIKLLQKMSYECDKSDPKYVDGAEPGLWLNSVTKELTSKLLFVPCLYVHRVKVWAPKDKGGGFKGYMDIEDPVFKQAKKEAEKFGKNFDRDGNALKEAYDVFAVLATEDREPLGMAVIPFESTKIKHFKAWNSRVSHFRVRTEKGLERPPMYMHLVAGTAGDDKNDKGAFKIPVLKPADPRGMNQSLLDMESDLFMLAHQCYELALADQIKADKAEADAGEGDTDGGEDGAFR